MAAWQMTLETVLQRDVHILEHQMWTDCVFIVGDEKKELKVHRLMLAKSSPVMAAMLYGELHREGEEIRVTDISPQVFEAMLRYMYEGQVQVDSFEVASGLLYAAKKYLLPESLVRRCRATVKALMYPDNVWATIHFGNCSDEPELADEAWKMVMLYAEELIIHPDLLQVPQSVVLSLVQQDPLAIRSELQLYKACVGWAGSEVGRTGGDPEDPAVLREVLAPVLPHIRFLTMSPEELVEGPVHSGILTDTQGLSLLKKAIKPELPEVPKGLCSKNQSRCFVDSEEFFVAIKQSPDDLPTSETWSEFSFNENAGGYYTGKVHLGVKVPTQVKPFAASSDMYEEDLTVLLYEHSDKEILTSARFTGEVPYDSVIDLPYKNMIFILKAGTTFELRVVFHTTGCYPSLYRESLEWPGRSGVFDDLSYYKPNSHIKFIHSCVNNKF